MRTKKTKKENGQHNPKRKKPPLPLWRKILRAIVALIVICFLGAFGFVAATVFTAPKIDPENIYDSIAQSSTLYDQDGVEIDSIDYGQDRTIIKYKDLPEDTINAFVAMEDKTFFKHHGFNWVRMIGAITHGVLGNSQISGTSTITQQLARNVYLPEIKSERSLRRKIIEMFYAFTIENHLSKQEIITAYLNSIYFGYGNYGIEAAANTYFSKHTKDLTLLESAALAAMPQSPDSYALLKDVDSETLNAEDATQIVVDDDTYIANDISKNRRDLCLELMKDQGYISDKELEENEGIALADFIKPTIEKEDKNKASYFTDYVVEQVIQDLMVKYDLDYTAAETMAYTGGLKIYTTLDSQAQETIEKEFKDSSNFPGLAYLNQDEAGNIVTESGAITLYTYDNMFEEDGDFVLSGDEVDVKKNGAVTIKAGHRLYIYTTETDSGTDYSIEFKPCYTNDEDGFYIYPGGYVNIPLSEKTLSGDSDVTISAEYLKDNPELFDVGSDSLTIHSSAYTLQQGVIQPQGAMVITEVGTGAVKAMVGGRGVTGSQTFNRATSPRQPGSSIKPLAIYSAALQKSYELEQKGQKFTYTDMHNDTQGTNYYGDYLTAASTIIDEPTKYNGKNWPNNSYNGYMGKVSMRKALQQSINVVAVKLYNQIGGNYCYQNVEKFGITTLDNENDHNAAALALGGLSNGVTPLEMSLAYATFPNGGVRNSAVCYTEVKNRKDTTILKAESEETEVLNEGVAWIMTDMLKSVVSQGIGGNASLTGVQSGGKTGTTSSQYDIWFDGFTPTYAASIWIGNDVNIELTSMSGTAALLWGKIMNQIPAATTGEYKDKPDNIVQKSGEYFTKGTETGLNLSRGKNKKSNDDEDKEAEKIKEEKKKEEQKAAEKEEEEEQKKPQQQSSDDGGDDGGDKPSTPSKPETPTKPEPSEPAEPSKPSEPSEPSKPSEPSEPTKPSEPTEPTEPSEPSEPTTPETPSDGGDTGNESNSGGR